MERRPYKANFSRKELDRIIQALECIRKTGDKKYEFDKFLENNFPDDLTENLLLRFRGCRL
jgi:hypothetical protein